MKQSLKKIIASFSLCFGLVTMNPLLQAQEVLLFGIADKTPQHVSKKILIEAYQEIGIQVETLKIPGSRSIRYANLGKTDGELIRSSKVLKDYPNLRVVPVPIMVGIFTVFSKTVDFEVKGWESLRPYKIAVESNFKLGMKKTKGFDRVILNTPLQVFKMLDKGRVDIAVMFQPVGLAVIKKEGLKGIKLLTPNIEEHPAYHLLHKKHEKLIPRIAQVLKKMKQSGRIQALFDEVFKKK